MFWQIPARSSKALQATGASLWANTESEVGAASPGGGCPCWPGSPADAGCHKLSGLPKAEGCGMGMDVGGWEWFMRQAGSNSLFPRRETSRATYLLIGLCGHGKERLTVQRTWGHPCQEAGWLHGPRHGARARPGGCAGAHVAMQDDYRHSQNRAETCGLTKLSRSGCLTQEAIHRLLSCYIGENETKQCHDKRNRNHSFQVIYF